MYQTTLELLTQLFLNALLGIFLFMFISCCVQSLIDFTVVLCKKDLEKQDDKVYYGELHSLHPDTRSFEVFEEVYYKGERWYIEYWSRHYGQDSFHLSLAKQDGYHKIETSSVDSREVKKIIRGKTK